MVYIVGAGPGDPELITVKGQRLFKRSRCNNLRWFTRKSSFIGLC